MEETTTPQLTPLKASQPQEQDKQMSDSDESRIVHILGLGLDNKDGHKRLTQAEEFTIAGGSEETHERMTETLVKTFEGLQRRGKTLHDADTREISDLIEKNTPRS